MTVSYHIKQCRFVSCNVPDASREGPRQADPELAPPWLPLAPEASVASSWCNDMVACQGRRWMRGT